MADSQTSEAGLIWRVHTVGLRLKQGLLPRNLVREKLNSEVVMPLTVPEQLDALLSKLRGSIRRYVLLRGLSLTLALLTLIFWISLLIDTAWFRITRLELSRETRIFILLIGAVCIAVLIYRSVLWQLMIQLRRRALALVLEKQFPILKDRLITVVEVAEQEGRTTHTPALSQRMLDQTLSEACRLSESLQVEQVFNYRPLKRAFLLAAVAVLSVAATAVASPATFSHWSKAYVQLAQDYWNRLNGLNVSVVAQPGDRVRLFEDGVVRHATGSDLTLLVETQEGKLPPEQVMLSYRTQSGARAKALMTPAGEGKFRHTIGNLVEDIELTVTGGDFTTVRPLKVLAVPEPQITSMTAICDYPDYTGWDERGTGEPTERKISSSEITVPMETSLVLQAAVSKSLRGVRISGREFELQLRRADDGSWSAQQRILNERGLVEKQEDFSSSVNRVMNADDLLVALPLFVTSGEVSMTSALASRQAIPIRESESMRIYLEDTDGIINLEPIRLEINGQVDEPPAVQTRLAGIGKAITRKAVMPFQGSVTDDYGLQELFFEFRTEKEEDPTTQPTERQPDGAREFVMEKSEQQPLERFDVLPLELDVDDVLYVTLVARDGDDLNGPHVSRGETYRMKIVSDEALLSLLYQDELNLRRRFEQVIEELERARDDLNQTNAAAAGEENAAGLSEATQRTLNAIQKDALETDAIRAAFESVLEELVNNRIDTPQIRSRLQDKIIEPLAAALSEDFETTEEHLRLLDFALREGKTPTVSVETCLADMDQLLTNLARILQEMRKLESFQEVIELLKGIIEDEKALKEKTEQERKNKLIDLLN